MDISAILCRFEDFEVRAFSEVTGSNTKPRIYEAWTRRPRFDVEHGCGHQQTQNQPELRHVDR